MTRDYWYYSISHSTFMINVCQGKLSRRIANPHELVYGEKQDTWTWFPLLYVSCFLHHKDGAVARLSNHSETLSFLPLVQAKNSNAVAFYNLLTRIVYANGDYAFDLVRHTSTHFGIHYDRVIFAGIYISYSDPEI